MDLIHRLGLEPATRREAVSCKTDQKMGIVITMSKNAFCGLHAKSALV